MTTRGFVHGSGCAKGRVRFVTFCWPPHDALFVAVCAGVELRLTFCRRPHEALLVVTRGFVRGSVLRGRVRIATFCRRPHEALFVAVCSGVELGL